MAKRAAVVEAMASDGQTVTAVRYVGDGSSFVFGVPARDLTMEEWAALGPEGQATLLYAGLYVVEQGASRKEDGV